MTMPGFAADWPAPPRVRSWQTVRAGGLSKGDYASLNLASHVGDDPAAVTANRSALLAGLDLPAEPAWLEQVHGTRIVDLDAPWQGPADGAVTARPGRVAVVMTADCVPVLLCDRAGTRVAAVHAGWRGLAAGVLEAALDALSTAPETLLAWLGPGISGAAYEVGDEVRNAFIDVDAETGAAFRPRRPGRWHCDLARLARQRLGRAGVDAVFGGNGCTWADEQRFFSHRRAAPCGRMATLIWLEPAAPQS